MAEDQTVPYFIGALITSAISWILLLATPFSGFNGSNYYLGVYVYGAVWAWSLVGVPILINAILLIYCTLISVLILRFPDKIPDMQARGIDSIDLRNNIKAIDYEDLVDILVASPKIVSWV